LNQCIRTDSGNEDFQRLAEELEAELMIRDGRLHLHYARLNKIGFLRHVVIAYENGIPVGCGAFREHAPGAVEIKRMYVMPEKRGGGFAQEILRSLENWAGELNYKKCVLETGLNQPEAIKFYKKSGFVTIPNFDRYRDSANSICFEKSLS
jgi:putative acetyltransferase